MLSDEELKKLRNLLKPTGGWTPDIVIASKLVNGLLDRLDAAESCAVLLAEGGFVDWGTNYIEASEHAVDAWLKACGKGIK